MIRLTLSTHPRTGTVEIDGQRWTLATWHNAAGEHMQATTSDGERVTAWFDRESGKGRITIGNMLDAPTWLLWDGRREGNAYVAQSMLTPSDAWLAGYVERMAGRVRG